MKISGYQMFWLICISSTIIFSYLPIHLATSEARQDSWISILISGLIMMTSTWIILRVCMQNQEKTVVGFMKQLLGTILGRFLVCFYFLHWIMQFTATIRGLVEFQNLVMLPNTPTILILLCLLFLVAYAVYRGGIVAVSRCAEVIGPPFILMLFVQLFLNPQDMNVHRIFPILADSGWLSILKGTFHSMGYMVDPSIILVLFFFADNKRTAARAIWWGTAVAMAWGVIATMVLLFVTGPDIAAELVVPIYSLTKFVTILDFVQNIDAFYIPFWLLGAFIKLAVGLFIVSYGLSEWTGYKNWKMISGIVTLLCLAYIMYSTYDLRLVASLKSSFINGIIYPSLYFVLPLVLWLLGSMRGRGARD